MGGLVAREMYRDNPNGKIKAMITVGTPHTGSNGANMPGSNNIAALSSSWVSILAAPWFSTEGLTWPAAIAVAEDIIYLAIGNHLQGLVDDLFGAQSVQDLKPGSSFLNTLNSNPSSTFPNAYYAVWSTEDWNAPYRLADAKNDAIENGNVMNTVAGFAGYYAAGHDQALILQDDYHDLWLSTGNLDYYDLWQLWLYRTGEFYAATKLLGWWIQEDWNFVVLNTSPGSPNSTSTNDGVVLKDSQVPGFIPSNKRIQALSGVNHFEQRRKQQSLDAIDDALTSPDIAAHVPPSSPLTASIVGPSSLGNGVTGTWTASVSGGSQPYTYDWDYQLLCGGGLGPDSDIGPLDVSCDTWHQGSTTNSFSRSVNGSNTDLKLRLTVTDNSSSVETEYKTVIIN